MSKKRLGKGLEALIPSYNTEGNDAYINGSVPIDNIIPNSNQPRQTFDNESLESLVASIKEKGIIQPLTVREISTDKFELIAGERRLRAAKKVGLIEVPVYVLSIDADTEMMEYALIENIQRVDLNPIEEAEAFAILNGKYGLSQEQIASNIGKSRSAIANALRLLKLPSEIKNSLKAGVLSSGHGRAILGLKSTSGMLLLFYRIIKEGLNVRKAELYVKTMNKRIDGKKIKSKQNISISQVENDLTLFIGRKVIIKKYLDGKGKMQIEFNSDKDLVRITNLISK